MLYMLKTPWFAIGLAIVALVLSPGVLRAGEAAKTPDADWPPKPEAGNEAKAVHPTKDEIAQIEKYGRAHRDTKSQEAWNEGRDLSEGILKRMIPGDPASLTQEEWQRRLDSYVEVVDAGRNPKRGGTYGFCNSSLYNRIEDAMIQWIAAAPSKRDFYNRVTWVVQAVEKAGIPKFQSSDRTFIRRSVVLYTAANQKEFPNEPAIKAFCTQLMAASSVLKNDKELQAYVDALK